MKNPASIGYLQEKISSEYIDKEFIEKNPVEWKIIKLFADSPF